MSCTVARYKGFVSTYIPQYATVLAAVAKGFPLLTDLRPLQQFQLLSDIGYILLLFISNSNLRYFTVKLMLNLLPASHPRNSIEHSLAHASSSE